MLVSLLEARMPSDANPELLPESPFKLRISSPCTLAFKLNPESFMKIVQNEGPRSVVSVNSVSIISTTPGKSWGPRSIAQINTIPTAALIKHKAQLLEGDATVPIPVEDREGREANLTSAAVWCRLSQCHLPNTNAQTHV